MLQCSPFAGWLDGQDIVPSGQPLAVAWSGGADSTALLLALKMAGFQVQAWHVDHAWRDSSRLEADHLASQAECWGVPFYSARLSEPSGKNRESEARAGRYGQFAQWAAALGVDTLCLGHHQDDQAETVYMRLLQGAGPAGCRGMHRERRVEGLRLLRPLLHLSSRELKQGLREAGIVWLEDPSNSDVQLWRNHIRSRSFPAMQESGYDPVRLFLRWKAQADLLAERLDVGADNLMAGEVSDAEGDLSIAWLRWCAGTAPIRARVLQKMMVALLGEGVTPGRRHIELVELWTKKNGRGGIDLSRCRLYRYQGRLHLQAAGAGFASVLK